MLARLWWKEYRVFGPVWLMLVLASGLLEWLFVSVNSLDTRSGGLTMAALCWAVLYAFATGAAAFAGERESKTLGFLDALPVPRWRLWLGKVSFALISTAGLALALAGMAALGTERRDLNSDYGYGRLIPFFGVLLFEAVAWSLLWSSMSKNPLLAGVMGVLSVYGSIVGLAVLTKTEDLMAFPVVAARLLIAGAALAVSGLVMTWKPPARSPRPERRAEVARAPVAIRASSTGRSLAWQAAREGWTTWLLVALVALAIPVGMLTRDYPTDTMLDAVLAILGSLVAGVSVFGTENATGSRRFLVHHGVRPGTVWWRKLLVWVVAVGSIFGLVIGATWKLGISDLFARGGLPGNALERLAVVSVGLVNAFAVGLLCGMTIHRRITAALVGLIVLIAVVPLQAALVGGWMVPPWTLVLVPLIFVAVSRLRAADWLLEREGAGPWLRLLGWLAVPFALLAMAYIGHRGLGVPDVRQIDFFFEAGHQPGAPVPSDQDAASAYRQAAARIVSEPREGATSSLFPDPTGLVSPSINLVIDEGWKPDLADVVDYWKKNQAVIDLARKASTLPRGQFEDIGRMTIGSGWGPMGVELRKVEALLALDARERLSRADLPGAWDDILAEFRLANQLATNGPTQSPMILATQVHHRAVGLAFDWLGSAGQAPETIRRALVDLKALPPLPDARVMVLVELSIVERSLDLPGDELAALLRGTQPKNLSTLDMLWFGRVVAAPWERQRARRVARQMVARDLASIVLEPYQRTPAPDPLQLEAELSLGRATLASMIRPNVVPAIEQLDREQVGRRALEQAVAIVAWKLAHEGKEPETLASLVPGLLDRLPPDPYSGRPFGYVRSVGDRQVIPPIFFDRILGANVHPTRSGQYLIYSVGPDMTDNGGHAVPNQLADYVYAIP